MMPARARLAAVLAVGLTLGLGVPASAHVSVDHTDSYLVNKVTGPGPPNFTAERWNLWATDLGHMFEHEGKLYMAFGDNGGLSSNPAEQEFKLRAGALAILNDERPVLGVKIDDMLTESPGEAAELFPGLHAVVVPTYGTSAGGRMILHYMEVAEWGEPSQWRLSSSGLAVSENGRTWNRDTGVTWPGDSNFGQVSIVTVGEYTYFFGIPGGRFGGLKLARARTSKILRQQSYEYWTGNDWTASRPQIDRIVASSSPGFIPVGERPSEESRCPNNYGLIVDCPVGELSVQWNSHYDKWLMMDASGYTPEDVGVKIRTADCLTGPWSEPQIVLDPTDYPTGYAPYIPPRWNDSRDIWFAMSIYGARVEPLPPIPYNVFWMHTALDDAHRGTLGRCVSPPG